MSCNVTPPVAAPIRPTAIALAVHHAVRHMLQHHAHIARLARCCSACRAEAARQKGRA